MSKKKKELDIFAEAEEIEKGKTIAEADLGAVTTLARKQMILEGEIDEDRANKLYEWVKEKKISIATIQMAVKMLTTDLDHIRRGDLPEMMLNLGMEEFTLAEGGSIKIKRDIAVNVKNENKPAFYSWMIKKGWQSLVKNKVIVDFPKEGRKSAKRFVKYLKRYYTERDKGITYNEKEDIHSQTLKAHVKRELDKGTKFPEDLIQIVELKTAKLT